MSRLIIHVLFVILISSQFIHAKDIDYKLNYQKSLFEKHFDNPLITYRITNEIEFVDGLRIKINNKEEIPDIIRKYDALFGLDNRECEIRFFRQLQSEKISVLNYMKFCYGYEVYQSRISVFLNNNILFGIRSNSINSDKVIPFFNVGEYEVLSRLKRDKVLVNIKDLRRILYPFGEKLFPVYLIQGDEGNFLRSFRYFIRATDGKMLFKMPLFKTIKGNVYIDSPEKDNKVTLVDLSDTIEYGVLKNQVADVYSDCTLGKNCDASKRLALPDNSGNYIFYPDESAFLDPFAEVMTYYHLNRLYNWFLVAGFEFNPFGVVAVSNFFGVGSEYDYLFQCNGFYVDRQVVLGYCPKDNPYNQSDLNINIAYDADIIMHELTHGFFDELYDLNPLIDNLGYSGMLYGLSEAMADFIPSHITDDEIIGRHMGKIINSNGIRNLTLVRKCPDYLFGEPHFDGEIISTALWGGRKISLDRQLFAKTAFLSLGGLNNSSSFKDFYENLINFITQASGQNEADRIKRPFMDRNVERCGRLIDLENGFTAQGYIYPSTDLGISGEIPYEVQFVYNVPDDENIVKVEITAMNYSGSNTSDYVKFYVNHNKPVSYSFESVNSDYVWVKRNQTLTNLKKGKYYILPAGDGQGYYYFKFRFAYNEPAPLVESVEPEEIKVNSTIDEFVIRGQNFHSGAKIRLPYGISYEDYEVADSNNIYVYNLSISKDTQCGYGSITVTNPDGQRGVGKSLLLIIKGNEKCKCDITFDCDESCSCDPDCSDGGCGCNLLY